MNKTELVETIAVRTELSKKDVDAVLGAFWDIIAQTVAKGKDAVTIPGWIKFERVTRDPRTVRNPQTGETIQVAAAKARLAPPAPPPEPPKTRKVMKGGRWITIPIKRSDDEERQPLATFFQ